jgi:Uma2 family endonuclease
MLGHSGFLTRDPSLARHRFTVSDYHRMAQVGLLSKRDRVELIEGEVITMTPIGSSHAGIVNRLTRVLVQAVGDRAVIAPQNPVQLDPHNEPQPDIAVLKPRPDDYQGATPGADDVLLVVEVADSSLVRIAATTPRWFCAIWPIEESAAEIISITLATVA